MQIIRSCFLSLTFVICPSLAFGQTDPGLSAAATLPIDAYLSAPSILNSPAIPAGFPVYEEVPADVIVPDSGSEVEPIGREADPSAPAVDDRPTSLIESLGLGRWRSRSRDLGITRRRNISLFYQGVISGGEEQRFAFAPKMDSFMAIDMGKLAGLEGFGIDFHVENRFGQSINALTGSVLPANFALQFPQSTGQASALTNLAFRQELTDNLAVTFGKLNTADRYGVNPFLGGYGIDRFQNTAFVVNPAFGRAVPYSTLGAGVTWYRDKDPIASLLVVDPTGEPDTAGFAPMLSNGVSLLGQLRLPVRPAGLPGHQSFDVAWSSGSFSPTLGDDYVQLPESGLQVPRRAGTWAINYGFDQYLVHDDASPGKGWGVFGNVTLADARTNPVEAFVNLGIAGNRLIAARPNDSFGLAWFYMGLNGSLRNPGPLWTPLGNQQGFEVYYNAEVRRWFHLTLDLQAMEAATPGTATSMLFGIRGKIVF